MNILLTGGSGTLGTELKKLIYHIDHKLSSPSSREFNIVNFDSLLAYEIPETPDILIHCAAYTDVKASEVDFLTALDSNIIGTCNIIKYCKINNIKLIHISTDHVFDGLDGHYLPHSKINPVAKYAKSKAAAEIAASMYDNCLIIRTSFFPVKFPYEKAFTDQYSSKDYVDIIAPKVLKAALSDSKGIVHCGSPRESIYNIAKRRSPDVIPIQRKDFKFPTLKDTSLKINQEFD